jgi:ABC-type transport system involved in cytochrome bd biosynthesis fused ATPase/permease subunit
VALACRQAGAPSQRLVAARASARQTLIETIDGLPELRSFGAENFAAADITRHLENLSRTRQRLSASTARGQSFGTLGADWTVLAVIAVASGLTGARALPAPVFVAVCLITIAVFEPIAALPAAVSALARARAACTRLAELFPATIDLADADAARSVRHPLTLELALANQIEKLSLASGSTVLVTGVSGSGKSTMLRALSRGEHLETGADDPEELAAGVTLVAQDAHVFDGTIRENLALADPGAGEPALWHALSAAALDDTVTAFPAGLDTQVGPGGCALSGGQRRRLSVAQGLLRGAPILLLDEPTEALDATTAAHLLAGVRNYDPSVALEIALHDRRLSTVPWVPTAHIRLDTQSTLAERHWTSSAGVCSRPRPI